MTHPDPFSRRPVASDAVGVLEAFRSSGGRSFHTYPVEQVRELYEQGCAANGLSGDSLSSVTDFNVDEFKLRIYDPRPVGGPTPGVLFLHGGGWVMGSLSTHDGLCRRLASLTALPVIAVDYRLAPEHRYPAAIDDCRTALRWLFSAGNEHGLDVSQVVLVGDSAGGQLAAVLAIENATAADPLPIAGQVLIYPMVDLTMASPSYGRVTKGFPLVADTIAWFADHYLPEGIDRSAPEISPALAQLPVGLPRSLVITVDNDPLVDEGANYAASLAQAGTEVRYQHLPGYAHGMLTSAGRIPRGEQSVEDIAGFIRYAQSDWDGVHFGRE
ncbi:alpha/beta hydrolase fold domain-containing protein [Arthrobacter sp. 260]|uniref:alpha/beta hydrolase fold domain-containing protein n=1 Tax=Arthrobacter sp. 260 TaxID=2735314 RepID=UPI0014929E00|nr:alpha/beta hydrolase [Arthrobacter sp. 260]